MTVSHDSAHRDWTHGSSHGAACLTDKYELMKEIGDGSFGSVALARVRAGGSHVARRGTLVAIKTMKKTFESFQPCLELREVIFLRTLPHHVHLVPALDIFLDPLTKKLHIAMEYMDGNLYQLMKARDHKPFDASSVKSILFQILAGLEHIHDNGFFHRDIKPENILVTVSAREDLGSAFKRYSQLATPPTTPPTYSIKIADFGLARETNSKLPFTTYVSTRWYRAPEVLLRAGEYSAPVDIWAIGAMAVEIATLKPLFPGGNEVDQVWRICEIMGSPGNWVNRSQQKVGGGEWKEGIKLAQKLGFSFPKMAPHTLDTILVPPQWPLALSNFVTWCLLWDPKARPTSTQAMQHEYFSDAVDPLRPKSAKSGLLNKKASDINPLNSTWNDGHQSLSSKTSSWFRKSLIARESAPAVPRANLPQAPPSPRMSPVKSDAVEQSLEHARVRPTHAKRNTWASGVNSTAAPIPILPSIRPISPLSNNVNAEAHAAEMGQIEHSSGKKIGRQLSVASNGNHYADAHRLEAERALNGSGRDSSQSQRESFFSHLRKRARRLSGRHQLPLSPRDDDVDEMPAGCSPWAGLRAGNYDSMDTTSNGGFAELDKALQNVRYSLEYNSPNGGVALAQPPPAKTAQRVASNPLLKRHHSLPHGQATTGRTSPGLAMFSSRSTRRAAQKPAIAGNQYETPDEQEELLDEVLTGAHAAALRLDQQHSSQALAGSLQRPVVRKAVSDRPPQGLPTPSSTAQRNSVGFDGYALSKPIDINKPEKAKQSNYPFPTPPYEENEWAASASASAAAARASTAATNEPWRQR